MRKLLKSCILTAIALFIVFAAAPRAEAEGSSNVICPRPLSQLGIGYDNGISVKILDTVADAPADAKDLSLNGDGSVLGWCEEDAVYLAGEGGINAGRDCRQMFYHIKSIDFGDAFYTGDVVTMESMFTGSSNLQSLDLSCFDTSNVTDMSHMFDSCESLQALELSSWNVENVSSMEYMFHCCYSLSQIGSFPLSHPAFEQSTFLHCNPAVVYGN